MHVGLNIVLFRFDDINLCLLVFPKDTSLEMGQTNIWLPQCQRGNELHDPSKKLQHNAKTKHAKTMCIHLPSLILGLCPANERRRYKVTPSLIG